MAVLRKEKRDKYTVIDNAIFMDSTLSLKAKGLLCQMLSRPDGWNFSAEGLATLSKDGKASVMSALTELEEAGYLRREQVKVDGKYAGVEYIVSETKMSDFPYAENRNTENQHAENRTQLNTKESKTKESNTNLHTHKEQRPTVEEIESYISEKNLNVDAKRFYEYFEAGNWIDSKGKPVRNWKQKLITWSNNNGTNTTAGNRQRGGLRASTGRREEEPRITGTKLPPMAFGDETHERSEDDAQVVSGRDRP